MEEKDKKDISKISKEVNIMVNATICFFFIVCFCAVFKESHIRGRQYEKNRISAYFKTDFEEVYEIQSSEVLIGTGKNADIRIHIPGISRQKKRWWGQKLAGIKDIHAYAALKEDGQFYIRNLSTQFPIYMEFGEEKRSIRPEDGEIKMYHGVRLIFGRCRLTFYRGVV